MASIHSISSFDWALHEFGAEIKTALPQIEDLLLFGSARSDCSPGDIDFAMIIPDEINQIDAVTALAPVLARLTARTGLLVSCFPINMEQFQKSNSQFIKNVQINGTSI